MTNRSDDGLLHGTTCEINVVDHCNLSCRGCSHLSPVLPRRSVDPERLQCDLETLAKHYRAEHVRLLGGEPLLHPDLLSVLTAVRTSTISDRIRIVTNGILLERMPDAFWELVDEVHISVYPGASMRSEQLASCRGKARAFAVEIEELHFDRFRESYSEQGTVDDGLVRRIYDSCLIAHRWRCHALHEGYFYKCPQSIYLSRLLDHRLSRLPGDGLRVDDSPEFGRRLRAFLQHGEPLHACRHCLGSVGRLFDNVQVRRASWRGFQDKRTEDLVDFDYLEVLERNDPDADNACVTDRRRSGDWPQPRAGSRQ